MPSSVGLLIARRGSNVAGPMQQDGRDAERGSDACQIVRDLRIGRGKGGDAHPVAELAAQIGAGDAQCREQRAQAVAHCR